MFHHGALGDSVLIWPLLRGLGEVTLVAPIGKARLAATWLDGVTACDSDAPDHTRMFVPHAATECSAEWREQFAGASTIISFVSTGNDVWAANAMRMAPDATRVFIRARPMDHDPPMHLIDFHAEQCREAGVDVEPLDPPPRRNPDGPVVVHPGSGGRTKRWPLERFIAVVEHLAAIGRPAIAVLGEVELETWSSDDVRLFRCLVEVVTPRDFLELSRVIAGASVYLGNDSGPTHLAAQLGVPTVALFGPTDPCIWSPVGPMVRLLAPPSPIDMTWLPPEPVVEALSAFGSGP